MQDLLSYYYSTLLFPEDDPTLQGEYRGIFESENGVALSIGGYFNFVQIPNMAKIPDEQKPAIGKVIAPAALFYFRWAAAFTVLSGLILAGLNGYLHDAMTLSIGSGIPKHTAIGIGMWLGLVMAFNVWFVIWPNQKRALGIVECDPELKAKSAKTAMLFSRTNTLLSLPMLLTMVAAQNLY